MISYTSCWSFPVGGLCQSVYSAWTCSCLVDEFVETILSYDRHILNEAFSCNLFM